ncbi:glycosyltransferase 87 family protein [Allorhizocola rhizosphaerae]|uniref:glycosyltransferase 87 family protein n=1 Tax=Allorhizocola rhizosphaerae TaxID=1872709 RepID=UPI001FEC212F|nr:glycosyltransferase 87 family protein [Allorhizocola rhizosphaerae]
MTRRAQIIAVVVLALVVLVFDAIFTARRGFFDLRVYYGAINFWVHDAGELYDYVRPRSTYGFTYPTFAAITMLPMAFLPWPVVLVIASAATVAVTVWLLFELFRGYGQSPWFVVGVALCLVAAYEPMRETFLFGQVNMLLVGLVAADLLLLVGRGSRWAGIGVGLATAIKLTPGIFIVYLLVTRRWRAALVSVATAAIATLFAAAVAPGASREFWTSAIWETDRVGSLSYISNQSLRGVVARLDPGHPDTTLWFAMVAGVLAVWAVRVWRSAARGDEVLGLALTGVVGVLVSPVTWIHHLVWAIPAFVLLVRRGGRWRLGFAALAYIVLCSRVVWEYERDFDGWHGFVSANAYVWIMLALLCLTPAHKGPAGDREAELGAARAERPGLTVAA